MKPKRIYLDNAATSWPKPEAVYVAVEHYQRELGAPAGRSTYREAAEVERLVDDARRRLADVLGAEEPRRIIFTAGGTDSLNLALHGLLQPGDHVVTTAVEHNSVLRPLRHLQATRDVTVSRVPCDGDALVDAGQIRAAIRPTTKLIVVNHASNVTGSLQPVEEIGRIARDHGVLFLIDAAQTAGHLPINVRQLGAHLLAAPGHKGLLSPLGVGLLYVAPGVEQKLAPIRQGGTGTKSEEDVQPNSLPDRYESGNHNVPGIVGLGAALEFIQRRGLDEIRRHAEQLTGRLLDGLDQIEGVRVYGPRNATRQVGVVSLTVRDYDPQEVALMLDAEYSIQTRPGIHCAPIMHRTLGTASTGGTVRISSGVFTTTDDIDAAVEAIAEFTAAATVKA